MADGDRSDYRERLVRERETYADQEDVHGDLPPSAHRWASRHVLPKLQALGVPGLHEFFTEPIRARAQTGDREVVVLSIGSGNGDQELGWLRSLIDAGLTNVRMRLLEFNPEMQQRAAVAAHSLGLSDRVELLVGDFNTWQADRAHDVVIACQALHHVLDLEHLYGEIRSSLAADGVLLVHDMIGRNGHRRWPEALEMVERIWATLPPELRRNSVTGAVDETYPDIDCSAEGFEGIRAQDVLPLLLDRLHPGLLFPFGNVIDPFVDRIYGKNFDMAVDRDRALIDTIGVLDDSLIDLGMVTPTHLIATFHPRPAPLVVHGRRTPERSVRDTGRLDPGDRVSFHPRASDPDRIVGGAGLVVGRMNGVAHDHWAAPAVELPILMTADADELEFAAYLPDRMSVGGKLIIRIDDVPTGAIEVRPGLVRDVVAVSLPAGRTFRLGLVADWSATPSREGLGEDRRMLSYVLVGLNFREATPSRA